MKVLNSEYIEENSITLDLEYFPVTRDGDKWTILESFVSVFLVMSTSTLKSSSSGARRQNMPFSVLISRLLPFFDLNTPNQRRSDIEL